MFQFRANEMPGSKQKSLYRRELRMCCTLEDGGTEVGVRTVEQRAGARSAEHRGGLKDGKAKAGHVAGGAEGEDVGAGGGFVSNPSRY